jgi:hypothetical protein
MMNLSLFRYILMAALRDRFFYAVFGVLVLVLSLSVFFGGSVLTEQDQFARSFAAFGFRLFGVASLVMFVVTYLRRAFEGRDVEFLLSRPIGRISFVLTHAAAFSFLGILCALLLGGAVILLERGALNTSDFFWWASLAAEFVIMANVAMFFGFSMTSSTACLMTVLSFYLLCRLIGEILGILQKSASGLLQFLGKIMEAISIFIPRLDLMGQSKWVLYGIAPDISFPFLLGQCLVFVAVIIGAALLDMHRRQF